jgi:hypothetical protein
VLRAALALLILSCLSPAASLAQTPAQSAELGPPVPSPRPRLQRPAPRPSVLPGGFAPDPAASLRLQALSVSLSDLAQREQRRYWPAALQLALGVGLGTAAVLVDDPGLRAAFTLGAAVSGGRAIVQFSVRAHVVRDELEFSAIEPLDRAALWRKLRRGELILAHAARVGRRQRILEGCLAALGAASFLPLQIGYARLAGEERRFGRAGGDWVGLSLSLITLASGIVQATRASVAERHYAEYRVLRRAVR